LLPPAADAGSTSLLRLPGVRRKAPETLSERFTIEIDVARPAAKNDAAEGSQNNRPVELLRL
jgi:hypothetical protein